MSKKVNGLTSNESVFIIDSIRKGYRKGYIGGLQWEIDIIPISRVKEEVYEQIEMIGIKIHYGEYQNKDLRYILKYKKDTPTSREVKSEIYLILEAIDLGYWNGRVGDIEWELRERAEYILDEQEARVFIMENGKILEGGLTESEYRYIELCISMGFTKGRLESMGWELIDVEGKGTRRVEIKYFR